jgi:putative ABC transport system permease protein
MIRRGRRPDRRPARIPDFNGMHSSTMNWASFSQMTFAFTVTPQLMFTGIVYGLILTFIAGILPGIRAARLPITAGLREL